MNDDISPKPTKPLLLLHVGNGLEYYTEHEELFDGKFKLEDMMRRQARRLTTAEHFVEMSLPEAGCSESTAALNIIGQFLSVLAKDNTVLSVATFSHGVLTAVVDAMLRAGCRRDLLIVVHPDKESAPTLSWPDSRGILENWSVMAVYPKVADDKLAALDFSALRESRGT